MQPVKQPVCTSLPVKAKCYRFWAQAAAPGTQHLLSSPSAPSVQKPFHEVCGKRGEFNLEDAQSEPGWTQPLYSSPDYTEKQFVTTHLDSDHISTLISYSSFSSTVLVHYSLTKLVSVMVKTIFYLWTACELSADKYFLHIWFLNCIINHVL